MGPHNGRYEENINKVKQLVDRTVLEEKPDIIVMSELCSTPYFPKTRNQEYFKMAEEIPGKTTDFFAELAEIYEVIIIRTVFEKEVVGGESRYYNTAFIVKPGDGLLGKYHKTHLPRFTEGELTTFEKYYFTPGDSLPVFNLMGVNCGLLICYDRSFPETIRSLTLKGAQVIFLPVAAAGFRGEKFIEELKVRALENGIFIVAVNKGGDEHFPPDMKPHHHFGKSCIINPYGDIEAELDDSPFALLRGKLDFTHIEQSRKKLNYLRDRRPELYGDLCQGK